MMETTTIPNSIDVFIPTGRVTTGGPTIREMANREEYEFYAYDNHPGSYVYSVRVGKFVCYIRDLIFMDGR